jgi:uncharacterized protein YjiS (DUF1127 family)
LATYIPRHSSAAVLFPLGFLFHEVAGRLNRLAARLDSRITAWKDADDDRGLLDHLSDHELRDIGINRVDLPAVRVGGFDCPRELARNLEMAVERARGC